jgi:hypothetical protein
MALLGRTGGIDAGIFTSRFYDASRSCCCHYHSCPADYHQLVGLNAHWAERPHNAISTETVSCFEKAW